MLYAAVEQAPSSEITEQEVINRYYARFDEQFFRVCDKELAKINTFFSGKISSLWYFGSIKLKCKIFSFEMFPIASYYAVATIVLAQSKYANFF